MGVVDRKSTDGGVILANESKKERIEMSRLDSGLNPFQSGTASARLLQYLVSESNDEDEGFPGFYPNAGRWAGDRIAVTAATGDRDGYADITDDVREEFDEHFIRSPF